jgi:hypothetical protein
MRVPGRSPRFLQTLTGQDAAMALNGQRTVWTPAACCAFLGGWFCVLLLAGRGNGVQSATTVLVATAAALAGGLARKRWLVEFPNPHLQTN